MKPVDGYNKLRGGYYTPEALTDFVTKWAIRREADTVLEPSCGDGAFLSSIVRRLKEIGASDKQIQDNVLGIELDENEAEKARDHGTDIACCDFFTFYMDSIEEKKKYDVILGNPPFIRYQNFQEEYRKIAFSLMEKHGFHPNRLTNIWLPFLLLSCEALKPGGRLGMVIPAELFQVDYAAEARLFLSTFFDSLVLVTFKQLVFDGIQQEVVLLLGEKDSYKKGIQVAELDGIQELISKGIECIENLEVKTLDHSSDKWVKYYLSSEELDLLARLNGDNRISNAEQLYEVNVGLVSGENAFFVINDDQVKRFDLGECITPIISRSEQLRGLILTEEDYNNLVSIGKKVFMFSPANKDKEQLSLNEQAYINWGEEQGYHKNYKCRIRPRWYYFSHSWCADAFLIRQANQYPKMILNQYNALVTDTLHKVRFAEGVDGKQVVAAFLNSYTLAISETIGRSYGGGVLTFEPGEMRKMRIPMIGADKLDLELIDKWQRNGEIEKILDYTDSILLKEGLGLETKAVKLLRKIWEKMRDRRIARKASAGGGE